MQQLKDWGIILIVPTLLLLTILYFNFSYIGGWLNNRSLVEDGIRTKATITKKDKSTSVKAGNTYKFSYSYEVDGKPIKKREEVEDHLYSNYAEGDKIAILYEESNPRKAKILHNQASFFNVIIILLIDCCLLALGFYIYKNGMK